jgi:adenylate kinase
MFKHFFVALCLITSSFLFAQSQPAQSPNPLDQLASAPPLIVLIGPPLSGKTALANSITTTYGIPAISVEDLIKENAAELERLRGEGISMSEMRYDPSMTRYLKTRVKTIDLSRGLVLDGYPSTLVQAEDLAKMIPDLKLYPIGFQIDVPDDVVRERGKKSDKKSYSPEIVDQRIKDYHREMDAISLYFPNAKIVHLDGNKEQPEVWKEFRTAADAAGIKPVAK